MGLTGFGDLREVHRLVEEGNEDAKLALDIYVHRIVGYIGNYTAQMGGVELRSPSPQALARTMTSCARWSATSSLRSASSWMRRRTRPCSKEPRIISTPDSAVTICVIPTNEELAIARKSAAIAEEGKDSYGNVFSK